MAKIHNKEVQDFLENIGEDTQLIIINDDFTIIQGKPVDLTYLVMKALDNFLNGKDHNEAMAHALRKCLKAYIKGGFSLNEMMSILEDKKDDSMETLDRLEKLLDKAKEIFGTNDED